jgi:hypothetical protein
VNVLHSVVLPAWKVLLYPPSWIQWYTLHFKDVYVLFHSFAEMLIDTVMFVLRDIA